MDAMDQITAIDDESSEVPRKSVFDRLTPSQNKSLESDDGKKKEKPGASFASLFRDDSSDNNLNFFPLKEKISNLIELPLDLVKKAEKTYNSTLYGYFLGPRLYFPNVLKEVKRLWGSFGFVEAMMNENGFFFFRFNGVSGMNKVLEGGPWMIRVFPLFVFPWDPLQGLVKPEHKSCPLWVKLHNIPLVAFNSEGISRIASALGEPKRMDESTAAMCEKAWGRPGYARVLVDVWAVGELKKELKVIVPNSYGGKGVEVIVNVEYGWEPSQCSHCKVFGHKTSMCVKAVKQTNQLKDKGISKDADGFTLVQHKKTKGIVIKEPTQGIKQSKPKQIYVPVDKTRGSSFEKGSTSTGTIDSGTIPPKPMVEKDKEQISKGNSLARGPEVDGANSNATPNVVERTTENVKPSKQSETQVPYSNLKEFMEARGMTFSNSFAALTGHDLSKCQERMTLVINHLMFKLGCWNVRGLNSSIKQREVRHLIQVHSLSFCALLETHVAVSKLNEIASFVFGSWYWISNQTVSTHAVRILIGWNPLVFDVMVIGMTDQAVHCQMSLIGSSNTFFVTLVYGSNNTITRRVLWEELSRFAAMSRNSPWCLLGDFNATISPDETLGGTVRRDVRMEDFADCVSRLNVFDLRYYGCFFTWSQKPSGGQGIYKKLDRVMVNAEFVDLFPISSVTFCSRGVSDHCPGIVTMDSRRIKKNPQFRFDNFMSSHMEFLPLVEKFWKIPIVGTYAFSVVSKLKNLKQYLRKLRSKHGSMSDWEIFRLLKADLMQTQMTFFARLFSGVYEFSSSGFIQRAKVNWIKEGDSNTAFFHKAVKERRNASLITKVVNMHGEEVCGHEVGPAFVEFFQSLLGHSDANVNPVIPLDFFQRKLTIEDANLMIRPITKEEVKLAMFSIGDDKAPGSDGYTSHFFRKTWHIVGPEVELAVQDFFYRGRLLRELNHTSVCLIPKSSNASRVTDYRPISLCTTIYKCIAKIISWRIKDHLDVLVSSNQSAFIPGRRITDNILMAHELMDGYGRQGGPPRCSFKIDIQKAYDSVDWRFLGIILDRLGFHPIMRHWIMEIVTTSSFSVMVNGESHGFFKGGKGLRQGCPLSPYLFTLVMETFSSLFRRRVARDEAFSFHKGCASLSITHLCFADDLMVFTKGDVNSVMVLKEVLEDFAKISGLTDHSVVVASFKIDDLKAGYPFVKVSIGDGSTTNAWEDAWLDCGHLADFVSYRFIHASGFSQTTTVRQLLDTFHDGWPDTWNTRFPVLTNLTLPSIRPNELDTVRWESDGQGDERIPPLWVLYLGGDRFGLSAIFQNTRFVCGRLVSIGSQHKTAWLPGRRNHRILSAVFVVSRMILMITCFLSVWLQIMENVHWVGFPCSWHAIVDALSNPTMAPLTVECKLALAASVYNIWCERNRRLFGGQQRPIPQVVQTIMANILDRIAWKRKKLMNSNHVLGLACFVLFFLYKIAWFPFKKKISGLKPNLGKSSVYFSNVDPQTLQAILDILPFNVGNLPFRYLGVPLSSKRLIVNDFAPLVANVRSRLLNWKTKFLSFGGRIQLIRSVLESLHVTTDKIRLLD
ncbi:LOW QUALITY PROTEIN: hypothetical protein OSB04_un000093 [Centaurea solstitialis]|uniref:Reverse transcriptase domain-containing protein n=1 Tax=Centaurea solstitialis TaxID=347529 RepID=A0AA38SR27_9ASTR|nr:LOW QUALITY PROTEIN: hypothetical protein OSB04_un000093 [Centaurea solstitialis]